MSLLDETIEEISDEPTIDQLKEKVVQYYQKIDDLRSKNETLLENLNFLTSKYKLVKTDKEQLQNLLDIMEEKYVKECELNEKLQFESEESIQKMGKLENMLKLERVKNSLTETVKKNQEEIRLDLVRIVDENLTLPEDANKKNEPIQNLSSPSFPQVIRNLESKIRKYEKYVNSQLLKSQTKIEELEKNETEITDQMDPLRKQLILEFERKELEVTSEKEILMTRNEELKKKFQSTWNELHDTMRQIEESKRNSEEMSKKKDEQSGLEMAKLTSQIKLLEKKIEYIQTCHTDIYAGEIGVGSKRLNVSKDIEIKMRKEIELERKVRDLEKLNEELSSENKRLELDLEKVKDLETETKKKNEEFSVIIGEYSDLDEDLTRMENQFEMMKSIVDQVMPKKSLALRRVIEKFKILMEEVKGKTGKSKNTSFSFTVE